jgi:hypothetical protein
VPAAPEPIEQAPDSTHYVVIPVDDVVIPDSLLPETPINDIVELYARRKVFCFAPHDQSMIYIHPGVGHGFIEVLRVAYDQHRPVVISPDHIWMLICQGVSYHFNSEIGAPYRKKLAGKNN